MPILKIENMAEHGIITDMLPHQLPPNAWTSGRNIRFLNNKAMKITGYESFIDVSDATAGLGTNWDAGAAEQIYWILPVAEGSNYYWIFAGLKNVGVYNKTTNTSKEITRVAGDYTATASNVNWTGGIIGGIPVINNGVDDPQEWDVDFATPGKLSDLTAWPASTTCGAMRVFKNYLVALDVTKSGTRYPLLVKWSDSAALGAVPASWDETDQTTDAGETNLAEGRWDRSQGVLLDCLPLRDVNILYRDDSVWSMSFVGGTFVFNFRQIYANQGMLARRCMAEFEGKHFVVGQSDIYVHDGTNFKSVIDSRRRTSFYDDIDPDNYQRTFVFANYPKTEMWVCYRDKTVGTLPNKALIWNWRSNTWGERDLPDETGHIVGGIVDTQDSTDVWSTSDGTWSDWETPWGDLGYTPQVQSPAIAAADTIYKGDATNQANGTNFTSRIERIGIPIGEQDEFVRIKAVYPRMEGTANVDISIGAQMAPSKPAEYQKSVSFDPRTDQKVDVRVTGTLGAIKISSDGNQEWELSGLDIEYEPIYRR